MELYLGIINGFLLGAGDDHDYEFNQSGGGSSPYDETLEWNPRKASSWLAEYKPMPGDAIRGSSTCTSRAEYKLQDRSHKDSKVYEALRQASRQLAIDLNELASHTYAETIRTRPNG